MRSVSGWNNTRREVMVDAALLSSKFEIQQPGHRDKYFFALKRVKKCLQPTLVQLTN